MSMDMVENVAMCRRWGHTYEKTSIPTYAHEMAKREGCISGVTKNILFCNKHTFLSNECPLKKLNSYFTDAAMAQ